MTQLPISILNSDFVTWTHAKLGHDMPWCCTGLPMDGLLQPPTPPTHQPNNHLEHLSIDKICPVRIHTVPICIHDVFHPLLSRGLFSSLINSRLHIRFLATNSRSHTFLRSNATHRPVPIRNHPHTKLMYDKGASVLLFNWWPVLNGWICTGILICYIKPYSFERPLFRRYRLTGSPTHTF